eukprot:3952800-Prymnesium_polylepis.1
MAPVMQAVHAAPETRDTRRGHRAVQRAFREWADRLGADVRGCLAESAAPVLGVRAELVSARGNVPGGLDVAQGAWRMRGAAGRVGGTGVRQVGRSRGTKSVAGDETS